MSLIHGLQNMIQINLPMKQKQTQRHGEQTRGCHYGGGGRRSWIGTLGLADAHSYL